MYFKLIVALFVLSAVDASPAPTLGLLKNILHPHHDHHSKGHSRNHGLLGIFVSFRRGVNPKLNNAYGLLEEIASYNSPGDFNSGVDVLGKSLWVVRSILNNAVNELGDIFRDLSLSILRGLLCVRSIWSHNYNFGICGVDYGSKWGFRHYSGKYDRIDDVFSFYNARSARSRLTTCKRNYLSKSGAKDFTGSHKVIFESCQRLADLVDRKSSSWQKNDFYNVFYEITLSLSVFGDSLSVGLGSKMADGLINYCKDGVKQAGIRDISNCKADITVELKRCNQQTFNEALDINSYSKDDDDDAKEKSESDKKDSNKNKNSDNSGSSEGKKSSEKSSGGTQGKKDTGSNSGSGSGSGSDSKENHNSGSGSGSVSNSKENQTSGKESSSGSNHNSGSQSSSSNHESSGNESSSGSNHNSGSQSSSSNHENSGDESSSGSNHNSGSQSSSSNHENSGNESSSGSNHNSGSQSSSSNHENSGNESSSGSNDDSSTSYNESSSGSNHNSGSQSSSSNHENSGNESSSGSNHNSGSQSSSSNHENSGNESSSGSNDDSSTSYNESSGKHQSCSKN